VLVTPSVHGHIPVPEAEWLNQTIDLDTGCVFGGKLTALRYPERELVSVPAARTYSEPIRPLVPQSEDVNDELLDLGDFLERLFIPTRYQQNVYVPPAYAVSALEVMSRFAVNPQWLIYLPPTMSPVETSQREGYLEYPSQAFEYYQSQGITEVICEEKHMGSRAIVVIGKDADAIAQNFKIHDDGIGICYTRTGRRFFDDSGLEGEFLSKFHAALTISGFWDEFATDWACFDCELMPWSVKAQALLRQQYAAVGAAGRSSLDRAVSAIDRLRDRGLTVPPELEGYHQRQGQMHRYVDAYRRYCWTVNSIADYKLAPFHIMATYNEKAKLFNLPLNVGGQNISASFTEPNTTTPSTSIACANAIYVPSDRWLCENLPSD
jgi:protein phosphatase